MTQPLRVALLQLTSCGPTDSGSNCAANLAKGLAACRLAKQLGADVALFPELWSTGYPPLAPRASSQPPSSEALRVVAIDESSDFVQAHRKLAQTLELAIALTYLRIGTRGLQNVVTLIDRHGRIALSQAKVHTCSFDWEAALTPGDAFEVCTLDTGVGPVHVGAMICFDREFPESARVLALKGAELILVPNACTLEEHRTRQLETRAFENMVAIAVANYAAPQQNGHSVAFHPQAFDRHGDSAQMCVVQGDTSEGIHMAAFDLASIRRWRKREVWGATYRQPQAYGVLTMLRAQRAQ